MLKCDFCAQQPITAIYEASDFIISVFSTITDFDLGSKGAWCTCATCEKLIDAGDWTGLVKHATDQFVQRYPVLSRNRPEIERDLGLMYAQMRTNGLTKRLHPS